MAIFDSILLGKSRGSVGNVTTARLKGQNVAKSKITSTTNVKSPSQVDSRNRMSNIVKAYQYLAIFLLYIVALRKPTESTYNAFVRGFKTGMGNTLTESKSEAASFLAGVVGLTGNFITFQNGAQVGENVTVDFATGGLPYVATNVVRIITFDGISGASVIVERTITEIEWNAGSAIIAGNLAGATNLGGYIYDLPSKKCSNVYFG